MSNPDNPDILSVLINYADETEEKVINGLKNYETPSIDAMGKIALQAYKLRIIKELIELEESEDYV